jgi:hypothetical protein
VSQKVWQHAFRIAKSQVGPRTWGSCELLYDQYQPTIPSAEHGSVLAVLAASTAAGAISPQLLQAKDTTSKQPHGHVSCPVACITSYPPAYPPHLCLLQLDQDSHYIMPTRLHYVMPPLLGLRHARLLVCCTSY